MARVILTHMFLFLLPFLSYALWLWMRKRVQTAEDWKNGPMGWLSLAGIILVLIGLAVFASFDKAPEGTEYIPSRMENGVFIPGRFE